MVGDGKALSRIVIGDDKAFGYIEGALKDSREGRAYLKKSFPESAAIFAAIKVRRGGGGQIYSELWIIPSTYPTFFFYFIYIYLLR